MSDYYSEHTVRGRRDYPCQFCGRRIEKGTLQVSVSIGSAGEHRTHRAHLECHELATNQPAPAHASEARVSAAR